MKKTQEILGLPVISISDGMEAGKVKSLIINADKGTVDYIVVDSGIQILSALVIPTDNILGIGEYAVTIENEDSISDIGKIPQAIDLLKKNIQVKNTKVMTKKGRLIGETGDIYIDENNGCKIVGLEFIADITQEKTRIIPRESVITFGRNLIVVKDDVESSLLDKASQLGSGDGTAGCEKKNLTDYEKVAEADKIIAAGADFYQARLNDADVRQTVRQMDVIDKIADENEIFNEEIFPENKEVPVGTGIFPEADVLQDSVSENAPSLEGSSAASLFEQRQRQYLIGRRATKTITDNYGNVIVNEGMIINNEIIDEAREKGKLIELVMNNRG